MTNSLGQTFQTPALASTWLFLSLLHLHLWSTIHLHIGIKWFDRPYQHYLHTLYVLKHILWSSLRPGSYLFSYFNLLRLASNHIKSPSIYTPSIPAHWFWILVVDWLRPLLPKYPVDVSSILCMVQLTQQLWWFVALPHVHKLLRNQY